MRVRRINFDACWVMRMDKDRQFQQDLKQTLERRTLDVKTRRDLKAARIAVLDYKPGQSIPTWMPAAALSCLLLVIVGAFLYRGIEGVELLQINAEELAIITNEDELELLEELEFYVWFDQEENA